MLVRYEVPQDLRSRRLKKVLLQGKDLMSPTSKFLPSRPGTKVSLPKMVSRDIQTYQIGLKCVFEHFSVRCTVDNLQAARVYSSRTNRLVVDGWTSPLHL